MTERTDFIVPEDHAALRLDAAVAQGLGLGLRQVRELLVRKQVRVDGRILRKGDLVRPGQHIALFSATLVGDDAVVDMDVQAEGVEIVAQIDDFAAVLKPVRMHSVRGRGAQCLEAALPGLGLTGWGLLNRLDFLTSGLVLATASVHAAAQYAQWQDQGLINKWYLAWAHGCVPAMILRGRILDDQRRVVRVTEQDDEPVRWTEVRPLTSRDGATLVLVRIAKGRRHQIRAHLGAAGYPLLGDPVYGTGERERLFLHHWRVELPGFGAAASPDWAGVDLEMIRALNPRAADLWV